MEVFSSFFAVALVSLLAAASPGPDFFIVVRNSLSYSRKLGVLTAIGVSLGLLIHLAYTLLGFGLFITEGSFFYLLLKYAGATYLCYLGCKGFISSLKKGETLEFSSAGRGLVIQPVAALKQGFLTNALNPKCALFFISFFSQFFLSQTSLSQKLSLAFLNWAITLGWFLFLSYMMTSRIFVSRIAKFRTYIDRVMGIFLIMISLKLFFF